MNVRVNKRISDSDTTSLFDYIDTVLSPLGDIYVSRFYSEDGVITIVADYNAWRRNSKKIENEMRELGYELYNIGEVDSDLVVLLDFQKAKVSD